MDNSKNLYGWSDYVKESIIMTVLDRLASALGRRDDVPNQELAREIARTRNLGAVDELARNLAAKDSAVRSDCLKTIYEIGYLNPELIAAHVGVFLRLLESRDSRLVWGAMIALGTVAHLVSEKIYENLGTVLGALENGSVITVDNAVTVLAKSAAARAEYAKEITPHLLRHLRTCRTSSLPQHAERCLPGMNAGNREEYAAIIEARLTELTPAQQTRVNKILKKMRELQ